MRSFVCVVSLLTLAAETLTAQAPRITPRGDPSVRSDSIYALAVDPAQYPEQTRAYLLDDGVIRLEADGRGTRTYRVVMQILREEAVESYSEMRFSWAPKHEKFTLNWIRVVRPDGTVISDKPNQTQESDTPAQLGDPIYSDRKVLRVSLTGVAVGTIVDYSVTTEELKPFLAGDGFFTWGITTGLPTRRSRYIVDVPADVSLMIREENLERPREERVVGRRRVYSWTAQDLAPVKPERMAADSNGVYQSVEFVLPQSWQRIGAWYASNARDRYRLTPEVEAKLVELVQGARTLDDSVRAVHRWVAQDVRYVSIALGLGGYQPRPPAEVLRTGFGDCKDKATIFIAMLQRMGLEAYPVILNSGGGVVEELPSLEQFDHVISAYRRPGASAFAFTDLTAEFVPLGELPFGYQGEFGIVAFPDGRVEEITFPKTSIEQNGSRIVVRVDVDSNGVANGTFHETHRGSSQTTNRQAFANPYDSVQKTRVANALASRWFVGATGADLVLPNGKDLATPPDVSMRIVGGEAITSVGSSGLMRLSMANMQNIGAFAREVEMAGPRRFPIDAQAVFGYAELQTVLEVTLPVGWTVELPVSVEESGAWGTYRKRYTQDGRVLRIEHYTKGASGIYPPERIGDLLATLRRLAADNATTLIIRR